MIINLNIFFLNKHTTICVNTANLKYFKNNLFMQLHKFVSLKKLFKKLKKNLFFNVYKQRNIIMLMMQYIKLQFWAIKTTLYWFFSFVYNILINPFLERNNKNVYLYFKTFLDTVIRCCNSLGFSMKTNWKSFGFLKSALDFSNAVQFYLLSRVNGKSVKLAVYILPAIHLLTEFCLVE